MHKFEVMIDTHSHMYADAFSEDIEDAIGRAKDVGITKILLPNIDLESIDGLNQLVDDNEGFFHRMMGLHPCSVDGDYKDVLEVEALILRLDTISSISKVEIPFSRQSNRITSLDLSSSER